ncbi:MAG: hypothetical protein UR64_C0025G0003 [Candidatus Nomurabacteria bacterium GW2011_GWE1_35_16]|uniref:Uncharacterized protein n=1 Tax=Candidatus Nomurabacteria bacterium GW2011_GWE1_35_16 TaxID=1618761 RepID=A0A0G0BPG4_9BACT|nr:MAG: hypothetical protein UR64_C0025G0003 [Candidatus Nomurabacteria bacterium GW2011_GWE1_35_16]
MHIKQVFDQNGVAYRLGEQGVTSIIDANAEKAFIPYPCFLIYRFDNKLWKTVYFPYATVEYEEEKE